MSIEWLAELGWKSLLLSAVTMALLALARDRSAAEKSLIGDAGLLSLLLLPVTITWLPRFELAAPQPVSAALDTLVQAPQPASAVSLSAPAAPAQASAIDWNAIAVSLYVLGAAALAAALLYALVRLRQLYRRARVLEDARWLTALAAAQNRVGVKHGTALLISDEVNSPISWGVVRPVIMIDPAARASNRAEAIIAHELAHVHRLDWFKLILARVAVTIFWFNPLVWVLARRCHQLREEAADDAVLRTRVTKSDYADLLVTAVRHANASPLLAANGVAPGLGSLNRRVMRVLDGSQNRVPAPLGWKLACFSGALFIGAPLAALTLSRPIVQATTAAVGSVALRGPIVTAGKAQRVEARRATATHSRDRSAEPLSRAAAARPEILSPVFAEATITAARSGDMTTLRQLLDNGGSVNAVLRGDGTPLIAAVHAGRADIAAFLLANGADPSLGVPGDGSPLIAAARGGRRDLVEMLLSRGASVNAAVAGDGTPLIAASMAGNEEIVRLLLDRGANAEQVVPGAETALITASRTGQAGVVRLLIGRGANVNSEAFGRTALSMAQLRGHTAIVDMLRKAGAVR